MQNGKTVLHFQTISDEILLASLRKIRGTQKHQEIILNAQKATLNLIICQEKTIPKTKNRLRTK